VRTCFKVLLRPWMDGWMDGWNRRRVYIIYCEDGEDGEDVRSEDVFQSPIETLDGWMDGNTTGYININTIHPSIHPFFSNQFKTRPHHHSPHQNIYLLLYI
jgi:hypothetical protein